MKIVIDNGHGRETAGKRSPDGRLLEWSYNREIARRVVADSKLSITMLPCWFRKMKTSRSMNAAGG